MLQARTSKTTLSFTPSFIEHLKIASQKAAKSMSRFIEDELGQMLKEKEQKKLKHMYSVLREMRGSGNLGITDASSTIDETLCGNKGAWKGKSDK